jgi:hypothetical protein
MFSLGILHAELDNFLDAGKCLINSFTECVAAFELGTGYDEDPILIGLDNDGNMDRFHIQIIGIPALMLFCSTLTSEEELFTAAWALATTQGCSGFDAYFISLAFLHNIPLLTDDTGMHTHAVKKGILSLLIRETHISDIERLLSRDTPARNNG